MSWWFYLRDIVVGGCVACTKRDAEKKDRCMCNGCNVFSFPEAKTRTAQSAI
jgi:hypothetical protein